MTTVTNTTGPSVSTTTIQGALTGVVPIDLDITLPSDYEFKTVEGSRVLRLKHHTNWAFLGADYNWFAAADGPPPGWTVTDETKVSSIISNPSGYSGETQITPGSEGATLHHYNNNSTGEAYVCSLEKTVPDWTPGKTIVHRLAHLNDGGQSHAGLSGVIYQNATTFAHVDLKRSGSDYVLRTGVDSANSGDTSYAGSSGARQAINEVGIYFRFLHGRSFAYAFDAVDDPNPPHLRSTPVEWTTTGVAPVVENLGGPSIKTRIAQDCWTIATPGTLLCRSLYYQDDEGVLGYKNTNCGIQSTDPAIQFVDDFDLGADSVLTVANLRTALVAAINNVTGDAAAWTFTAVRNAATGASAGTYAAAGSTTIAGSGRYFSLWGKCNSNGSQTGSIDADITVAYTDS